MKPYVNFIELETNKKVQQAIKHLRAILFPKNKETLAISWELAEQVCISINNLKGKDKALFLGHSQRWAGTPLT